MNDQPEASKKAQQSADDAAASPQPTSKPTSTPLVQLNQTASAALQGTEEVESQPVPVSDENLISADSSPADLVKWGLQRFAGRRIVLSSSFGMEGCALIDMCDKSVKEFNLEPITVAYIDTGFFFPETHSLRKKLTERYDSLNFVAWETKVSIEQQAKDYGNELWKNNPNLCCHIRKVVPMKENVVDYDVWITALRRSQTKSRANTEVVSWDWKYQILKFCPFASWSRGDVWNYIQENDVPFNQLHLQGFPSVSCFHCTQQVEGSTPDSDVRDGRWAGKNKDECGLHFNI